MESSAVSYAVVEYINTVPSPEPADMDTPVAAVEKLLNYKFKNTKLLEEALTHSSCTYVPNYQRLEFLGDAALGFAVTNYIYLAYPQLDQHQLTLLRSANVSTEKLARVAVRHGLYRYVGRNASDLDQQVRDFILVVQDEDKTEVHGGAMKAPKVLSDIVESVAGAVYIDCGHKLEDLWVIYRGLLEPIVTADVLEQQPQPVTTLHELCQKDGKKVKIRPWTEGEKNITGIFVDGELIASSSSELDAAKLALQKLSYQVSDKVNINLELDLNDEVQLAKQKLNELCCKRKWPKPRFSIDKETGPTHLKKYVCSVKVETIDKLFVAFGDEKSKIKAAKNSAASSMLRDLHEHNLI